MSISEGSVCLLQPLGLLGISGPDTVQFLQGQLSNDVSSLSRSASARSAEPAPPLLRAGLHNPQGRTLALLGLVAGGPDRVLALLPRELVGVTRATLQRYVLRSKVVLSDESDAWRIYGLNGAAAFAAGSEGALCVQHEGARHLLIVNAAESTSALDLSPYSAWHAADVAAGLPQVYAATSGQFVAQMLNLDCIAAISFTKGCYTGQEVIARAHYRGRVKRRMQRFLSSGPLRLSPGDSGELSSGAGFRVVDSVQHPDGRCEFLAVTAASDGHAGEGHSADGYADDEAAASAATRVEASALPLPYPLPE